MSTPTLVRIAAGHAANDPNYMKPTPAKAAA